MTGDLTMTDFPSAPPPLGGVGATPAGFGDRAVALLIDIAISIGLAIPGIVLIIIGGAIGGGFGGLISLLAILLLLVGFLAFIYIYLFGHGNEGQTPGKRAQGVKLIKDSGETVGIGGAFVRYILGSILNSFCYIGFLWFFFDAENRTLYDKILGNQVVKVEKGSLMPLFPGGNPF